MNPSPETNELDEELEAILTKLENEIATDITRRVLNHTSGKAPKQSHWEAKEAIKQAIEKHVICEDEPGITNVDQELAKARIDSVVAEAISTTYDNPHKDGYGRSVIDLSTDHSVRAVQRAIFAAMVSISETTIAELKTKYVTITAENGSVMRELEILQNSVVGNCIWLAENELLRNRKALDELSPQPIVREDK